QHGVMPSTTRARRPERQASAVTPRRFLITTWDGGGNTPPAFNLALRLARRGHCTRMLGWESMAARAATANIDFAPYRSMTPWPPRLRLDDAWERLVPLLHGAATRDDIAAETRGF